MLEFMWEPLSLFYYRLLLAMAVYFFILSLANHYEVWHFTLASEIFDGPMVSIMIPARNEGHNIERCLDSLRNQIYKNYEILVLNDNSTDNTLEILNRIAATDSRVKIFDGKPLPQDWYGKPFAMHQLAQQARGEIFIFTDADTIHTPTSIAWTVTNMLGLKADLISGYVGQELESFGEIVTVPLMFFLTVLAIPLFLNRLINTYWFSAAIGQFIAVKRTAFEAIGGCENFKKRINEDIYMSRYIKNKGYSTRFLNITEQVKCRMYKGYRSAVEGIGKNIFVFMGKNSVLLFFSMLAIFFFLFLPFPLLFLCIAYSSPWTLHILAVVTLHTLTWLFVFLSQRLNWWYGFLWPLFFLNLLYMATWSWFRTVSGRGFFWKDRVVS
jgi:chlorobactene glucosyltransferase